MEKRNSKPTNAQLLRRIQKSPLHLDFTKNTISVYFSDKGLRLTVDDSEGYALIATGYHTHCFQSWTSNGISRPFLYTKRVIEIANENLKDIEVDGGYSFQKLLGVLKAKEDKSEYNIVTYVSWYFNIIFAPLYAIDENAAGQFNVYFKYLSHLATQHIFLSEHKDGMTNKQFVEEHNKLMKEFLEGMTEAPIFEPMSDEQRMQSEMEAMKESDLDQQAQ